jgi:hypothetical protein
MSGQYVWLGTAPFCGATPSMCQDLPGYVYVEDDKCGDGSCCWSGKKVKCQFNDTHWKQSPLYSEIQTETYGRNPNFVPNFVWFGEAPLCGADPCSVFSAGMLPIQSSKCGNGSCCMHGEKWLGTRPMLKKHHELINMGMKECNQTKRVKMETIGKALDLGKEITKAIAAPGYGGLTDLKLPSIKDKKKDKNDD